MSWRKNLRQSDWQIELSPQKNVEPRIVGIRSTFRGSTFFRLVEIRLYRLVAANLISCKKISTAKYCAHLQTVSLTVKTKHKQGILT